jgi:hypothetical protein
MSVIEHLEHSVPIEGYPDYRICPCGFVLSMKKASPRLMAVFVRSRAGHCGVNLCRNGQMKMFSIHVLVANAFLPPPQEGQTCVLHGDDNPAHNAATNLKWGTNLDNSEQMVRHGRQNRGSDRALSKLTESQVREIRHRAEQVPQAQLAREYGVSTSTLNSVVKGQTWRHVS